MQNKDNGPGLQHV